jgi:phage-related protein
LWEIRSDLPSQRTARAIFCIVDGQMVLLHGFIKKTQKTPKRDVAIARERKAETEPQTEEAEQ